jgi:hypothetical protein
MLRQRWLYKKRRPALRHPSYTNAAICSELTVDEETLGQSPPFSVILRTQITLLFGITDRAIERRSSLAIGLPEAPTFRNSAYVSGDAPPPAGKGALA